VNTRGDDFLATFDGPGRAVKCAGAIAASARPLGLEVRAGLHTGEIEVQGDDVAGLAVHIGARVCSLAGADEVLSRRRCETSWSDPVSSSRTVAATR
jgi:class 3 adenylate cyclase